MRVDAGMLDAVVMVVMGGCDIGDDNVIRMVRGWLQQAETGSRVLRCLSTPQRLPPDPRGLPPPCLRLMLTSTGLPQKDFLWPPRRCFRSPSAGSLPCSARRSCAQPEASRVGSRRQLGWRRAGGPPSRTHGEGQTPAPHCHGAPREESLPITEGKGSAP